jgi:hypothetical protein
MELLWERMSLGLRLNGHLAVNGNGLENTNGDGSSNSNVQGTRAVLIPFVRLPNDPRCIARRKDGQRCKGRARPGSDHCLFHDPAITPEQRREIAARGAESRRRRVQLPKGYPRRLDSQRAVQRAMDRLCAEIRQGVIDATTGRALFEVLSQMAVMHGGLSPSARADYQKLRIDETPNVPPASAEQSNG